MRYVFGRPTDCGTHRSRIAQTADPIHEPTVCGSQHSADPLTVGHTVRVSHRLRTRPRATCLRIAAFGRPNDCGSHVTPFAYRTDCAPRPRTPVCGSQRLADPLTVGHTIRVSHRLRITVYDHSPGPDVDDHSPDPSVDDHATVDRSVRQTY